MPYFKFISFVYVGGGEQMYVYMYVVCMYRASIGVPQHGCGCQMVPLEVSSFLLAYGVCGSESGGEM